MLLFRTSISLSCRSLRHLQAQDRIIQRPGIFNLHNATRSFADAKLWARRRNDRGNFASEDATKHQRALDPEFAEKQEQLPNMRRITAQLKNLGRAGKWREALHVFQSVQHPNQIVWAAIIAVLVKAYKPEAGAQAVVLFKEMPEKNIEAYTTMIDHYGRTGELGAMEGLWEEMNCSGIKPTKPTYGARINGYAMRMQPDMAEAVWDEFRAAGFLPDKVQYTSIISAWSKVGQYAKAKMHFDAMLACGMQPELRQYTALLTACIASHNTSAAGLILDEVKSMQIKADVVFFTAAINVFRKDLCKCLELVDQMKSNGLSPNLETFKALLQACLYNSAGDWGRHVSLQVEQLVQELGYSRVPRDVQRLMQQVANLP